MPQVFGQDRFGGVTVPSGSVVQMDVSDFGDIKVTFGGQQYSFFQPLQINTAINGLGGLDTGGPGNTTIWFIHFVLSGSTAGLVASQNAVTVTGFPNSRWSGWFFVTNASAQAVYASENTVRFSGLNTPATGLSGNYIQMNTKLTTPNIPNSTWLVNGFCRIGEGGVACGFIAGSVFWTQADGNGTNTQPPLMNDLYGGSNTADWGWLIGSPPAQGPDFVPIKMPPIYIPANTTIYLVPVFDYQNTVSGVVAANGQIEARRIS